LNDVSSLQQSTQRSKECRLRNASWTALHCTVLPEPGVFGMLPAALFALVPSSPSLRNNPQIPANDRLESHFTLAYSVHSTMPPDTSIL
jgi:hypothetical protein